MKALRIYSLIFSALLIACVDTNLPTQDDSADIQIHYSQNLSAQFQVRLAQGLAENIEWDFGDGYQGTGNNTRHQYLSPGEYKGKVSYQYKGDDYEQLLDIRLDGINQNLSIKPTINISIDSDHNDPNQAFSENNQTPQTINSPVVLSGIVLKKNACQAGRLCDSGDLLDWYSANLNYGDTIEIEIIKGSVNIQLIDATNSLVTESIVTSEFKIPSYLTTQGQYQLKIHLNESEQKAQYLIRIEPEKEQQTKNYQPGKLIVQWHNTQNVELVDISDPRITNLNLSSSASNLPQARRQLAQHPSIKSVSLNYYRHSFDNSQEFAAWQWPLEQQNIQQLWQPLKIRGFKPGENTTIAVLDTGLYFQHQNLSGLQHHSAYDFVSDPINSGDSDGWDSNPTDPGDQTLSYHGTHVTGIIAAQPQADENEASMTGIAWGAHIMPVRVLGMNGGTSYDLIQALRYAAGLTNDSQQLPDTPADIINLSLGGDQFSVAEQTTINEVIESGAIIVAAAGNQGQNQVNFPAAYKHVIAVGASDAYGNLAPYSNYGAFLDVIAPGGSCLDSQCSGGVNSLSAMGSLQTQSNHYQLDNRQPSFKRLSGTSMATAHVSALLAIVRGQLPGLDAYKANALFKNQTITTDLFSSGFDQYSGWGKLNSEKLLSVMDSSDLDQASIWTNQTQYVLKNNQTVYRPIIHRGDASNHQITAEYDRSQVSISIQNHEMKITTLETFTQQQTAHIYLNNQMAFSINIYPQTQTHLPEFSQHLYLNFENSSLHSSGLRTVIEQDAWQANIPPLIKGQTIQASSDIDYDGVYCEMGEFCAFTQYNEPSSVPDTTSLELNGSILSR